MAKQLTKEQINDEYNTYMEAANKMWRVLHDNGKFMDYEMLLVIAKYANSITTKANEELFTKLMSARAYRKEA